MRRSLVHMLCLLAALGMLLHGAAAMACDAAVDAGGADMEMADEMIAGCPACDQADSTTAGDDSCSVACSSVTACIHTGIAGKAGDSASVLAGLELRTERSLAVEPPPPRSNLLL